MIQVGLHHTREVSYNTLDPSKTFASDILTGKHLSHMFLKCLSNMVWLLNEGIGLSVMLIPDVPFDRFVTDHPSVGQLI